jgi:hypothetical protein
MYRCPSRLLLACLTHSSTLKIEAEMSSETSLNFYKPIDGALDLYSEGA